MLRLAVLFAAALAVNSQTTSVSQCVRYSGPLPLNVHIENCETPPCQLPQMQDAIVNIIFRAPRTIERMTTLATAILPGLIPLPIPYNLGENAVTCNFLENSFCPVLEGEILIYTLRMYIESAFPVGTQANIEFRIVDPSNTAIVCIRVPITIVPAVPGRTANSTLLEKLRS